MINLEYVASNLEAYKKNLQNRQLNPEDFNLDELLARYSEKKNLSKEVQELQRQRNLLSGRVEERQKAKEIKTLLSQQEGKLRDVEQAIRTYLRNLPNVIAQDVPVGKSDKDNVILREVGERPSFSFLPKDYLSLAKGLIDMERGANVAGTRFGYIFGDLVLLEFALVRLAFDVLTKEGFVPVLPPVMIKPDVFAGMGRVSKDQEKERYYLERDHLYLVGSAEHTMGPIHMNEVLKEEELPKRYVGFSSCFRREAGSYGKDTKGILRVHQFDKVEMFSFTSPESSEEELQFLLTKQEKLMQALNLPYRVVQICTGDLGFTDAKQYDIETWLPGQGTYRETHSCSNTTDFQARGINVKYKNASRSKLHALQYVHMLNATAFAIGRMLIAVIENYQQKDGSILIPQALHAYMGKGAIHL